MLLVILSGYTAAHITSIQSAWQLLLGMGAGTGGVLMLRWYWWRVNAWSEISAMVAAFVVSVSLQRIEFSGNNVGGVREDGADHHRGDHDRVARDDFADAARNPTSGC